MHASRRSISHLALAGLAAVVIGCGGAGPHAIPPGPGAAPGQLVVDALDAVFARHDAAAVDAYFAADFQHHNPMAPAGLAAVRGMADNREASIDHRRVLVEGDLVVVHSRYTGFGPTPVVAFDVFRIADGKIAENWFAMTPEVDATASGRTQLDGPTAVTSRDQTATNKALIERFFADVLYGHDMSKLTTYVSTENYAQHNPAVGDGLDGFGKAMAALAEHGGKMEYTRTLQTIADGDFVFTRSEGIFGTASVTFCDLFRIAGGKIVEHWDVIMPAA